MIRLSFRLFTFPDEKPSICRYVLKHGYWFELVYAGLGKVKQANKKFPKKLVIVKSQNKKKSSNLFV